jgi:hypothetical protein
MAVCWSGCRTRPAAEEQAVSNDRWKSCVAVVIAVVYWLAFLVYLFAMAFVANLLKPWFGSASVPVVIGLPLLGIYVYAAILEGYP